MNMISTGTFLNGMEASKKQQDLVRKLTGAWEKKNSKAARAGGVSLMALSLAACGAEDDTPFSQTDVDAAVAASEAELIGEINTSFGTSYTSADAPAVIFAGVAASDNGPLETAAATALVAQATAEATAAAAMVATAAAQTDAATALVAQAAAEATAATAQATAATALVGKAAAETAQATAEASLVTAQASLATAQASLATAQASLTSKTAEYDALVTSNSTLQGQYDALVAPQSKSFTAATAGETLTGLSGADTFTGDKDSIDAADSVIDATVGDGDTANLTFNDDLPALTLTNVENVNITVSETGATGAQHVAATNFSGVDTLTITKGDVVVGGSSLAGNKAIIVSDLGSANVAKVVAGAGTTAFTAVQTVGNKAGMTFDVNAASGAVDITGAGTFTATGQGTGDTFTLQLTGNAVEDAKAVNVTTGAENIVIPAFTGTIDVTGATSKNVAITSVAGGATVNVAGESGTTGTDGVNVAAIDLSGFTLTTSYAGTTTAAGAIQISGSAATTDVATISANGVNNLDNDTTLVETLTLSGNTAAATFTNTDLIATTVTIAGSQNVSYADSAADFDGVTITDTSTGTSTVVLNGVVGGAEDLSLIAVDNISVTADINSSATNTIKVANNATVTLAKDQAAGLFIDGKTAKDDLNIVTADDTAASGAVIDIATTTFDAATNFDAVSLTADVGKFTATAVTLAADAVLTITGSKDVALGNITAKEVAAGTATGKISMDTAATGLTKITTGSAVDTITVDQAVAYTIDTGAGGDTLTIAAAAAAGGSIVMGDGNDTVNLNDADSQVVVTGSGDDAVVVAHNIDADSIIVMGTGTGDTLTLSDTNGNDFSNNANFSYGGIETMNVSALTSGTIKVSSAQFANDNTFKLSGNAVADTLTVTNVGTTGATIDASNVTYDATVASALILEGKALLADTITGSAKDDTITGTSGGDSVDGGLGSDTFIATSLAAATIEGANTGTSAGVVVNLGLAAITNTAVLGTNSVYTADTVTSVASGQVAYVYAAPSSGATVNSATITTLQGIENVTGTSGKDYIVGSAAANTITGAAGADYIRGGAGNDTVVAEDTDVNLDGGTDTDTISLAADASFAGDTFDNFETFVATGNGADLTVDYADFTDFTIVTGLNAGAATEFIKTTTSTAVTVDLTAITFTDAAASVTTSGAVANTIKSGTGGDAMVLGATGINSVNFQTSNGTDVITGFLKGTDLLDFADIATSGTLAELAIANDAGTTLGATTFHASNSTVYVIDTDATQLGSSIAATITDFTDMTKIEAFMNLDDGLVASGAAGRVNFISINDISSNLNYIYKHVDDGDGIIAIEKAELSLMASVDIGATATLSVTEIIIA
jgi:hypothetical protein